MTAAKKLAVVEEQSSPDPVRAPKTDGPQLNVGPQRPTRPPSKGGRTALVGFAIAIALMSGAFYGGQRLLKESASVAPAMPADHLGTVAPSASARPDMPISPLGPTAELASDVAAEPPEPTPLERQAARTDAIEESIASLRSELSSLGERVSSIQGEVTTMKSVIAGLEEKQQAAEKTAAARRSAAARQARAAAAAKATAAKAAEAKPAAQILSVDVWDGKPSVSVTRGVEVRFLSEGDHVGGFTLQKADVNAQAAVFVAPSGELIQTRSESR